MSSAHSRNLPIPKLSFPLDAISELNINADGLAEILRSKHKLRIRWDLQQGQ